MTDEERNEADLRWCAIVGASVVDELLVAKLITDDQAEWARQIAMLRNTNELRVQHLSTG